MQHENGDVAGERLLSAARNRVRRYLPGALESADPVAGMFTYAYGQGFSDLVCMVAQEGDCVRIGFYDAEDLSDPTGLLVPWRGNTRHRYLNVAGMEALDDPALAALLAHARARHAGPATAAFDLAEARSPTSPRPGRAGHPAAEVLVCLLTGLVVGAMFAAALDSSTFGLVLGLVIATILVWIGKAAHEGAE